MVSVHQYTPGYVPSRGHLAEIVVKRVTAGVTKQHPCRSTKELIAMLPEKWVNKLNKYSLKEDDLYLWEQSPRWLLDKHWGIDMMVNYRGWCLAIDITCENHPTKLRDKRNKMGKSAFLETCPTNQVDACAVWVVNPESLPDAATIKRVLSQMAKQPKFTEVYYL